MGSNRYLDFFHQECGTDWRLYLDTNETITPIPKPPTMAEMTGKKPFESKAERRVKELESVLRDILADHERSVVNWPAMRKAKELLK